MLFEYVQYKDIGNLLKSLRHTKFWVYKEIAYLFLIGPSKYLCNKLILQVPMAWKNSARISAWSPRIL